MITGYFHPHYLSCEPEYYRYRTVYSGGRQFINSFLQKFSLREDDADFATRKSMTYCPAFCSEAVDEIKNNIFQRMHEIVRKNGSDSYHQAVAGKLGGVDLKGSTMNSFLGQTILPELLVMGRVGIYVDRNDFGAATTLAQLGYKSPSPYLYYYRAEDILNWDFYTYNNEIYFNQVLLRETELEYTNGLPSGECTRYRHLVLTDQGVQVTVLKREITNKIETESIISQTLLNLPRIPFILADIGASLIKDICDYQIALLNIESSDIHYILKSNFPFYVEQYDPKMENIHAKQGPMTPETQTKNEVVVGNTQGRRYPLNAEAPSFIHPSSEPLLASMKKQEQIIHNIRRLLNLALDNVTSLHNGIDSGLAGIGLELLGVEQEIAKHWEAYYNRTSNTEIIYPTTYSLKTDEQRQAEATSLKSLKTAVPSRTFSREVSKEIVRKIFEGKLSHAQVLLIESEIDAANYVLSDPEDIRTASELGYVSAITGSNALGFNGPEEVPTAQIEHAKRLATIAISQSQGAAAARGVQDLSTDPLESLKEKEFSQRNPDLATNPAESKVRS